MSRLHCCVCNADLGDADDPYRDPSCIDCLNRQILEEDQCDADPQDETTRGASTATRKRPTDSTSQ